ncbi:MAG: cytochrome P450 [Steroidobacteraceae bacterium]
MKSAAAETFRPPRTPPLSALLGLLRTAWRGEGDLLSLMPAAAYRMPVGRLGYSRRTILLVNDPALVREILADDGATYPKGDLMVAALEPLVGDSIFVSSAEVWRRQRAMIDPAFSHMRLGRAFASMQSALDEVEARLDEYAASGAAFSLDLTMSHLTADIICRTVFSTSLQTSTAREVFDAFAIFERSVAQVELRRLIFDPAWTEVPQREEVLAACNRIRHHLGELVDGHAESAEGTYSDIAAAVMAARDAASGGAFTRKELIDQLGVFFLAGHETTASALTWAFFIAACHGPTRLRIREDVAALVGDAPVDFEATRRLVHVRNVFRETLRLYPPITFMPRVALGPGRIGRYKVRRGTLVMISPWALHRHQRYWRDPDLFDPDRFLPARESELTPGAYLPFGAGPRVCVGQGFAMVEAVLILARLLCRYDFEVLDPGRVRPVARLTTRPAEQIMCRVRLRG